MSWKFTFRTKKTELLFKEAQNIYERTLVWILSCIKARASTSLREIISFLRCGAVSLTWISKCGLTIFLKKTTVSSMFLKDFWRYSNQKNDLNNISG